MRATFSVRFVIASCATLVAIALAGCAGSGDIPPESTLPDTLSASPSPSYPSREEILREAMHVLADYDRVAEQISSDYSIDASLLSPYAVEEEVDSLRGFQQRMKVADRRLVGLSLYSNEQVQEYDPTRGLLRVLICADVSNVRVIDANGNDVTPPTREDTTTAQITFAIDPEGLKVKENLAWAGESIC